MRHWSVVYLCRSQVNKSVLLLVVIFTVLASDVGSLDFIYKHQLAALFVVQLHCTPFSSTSSSFAAEVPKSIPIYVIFVPPCVQFSDTAARQPERG